MALTLSVLIGSQLISSVHSYADIILSNRPNQYKNSTITCNNNGDCKIICSESHSCYKSLIICPRLFQCDIECNGPNSCQLADISCPYGDTCSLTCSESNSCRQTSVNAQFSTKFNLNNCNDGDLTCNGMTIYFPPHYSTTPRATINGGNHLTSLYNEPLNFYAIFGWLDISIINNNGDLQDNSLGFMHCLPHYQKSCTFLSHGWQCLNTNSICNDPPTQQPTAAPTASYVSYSYHIHKFHIENAVAQTIWIVFIIKFEF